MNERKFKEIKLNDKKLIPLGHAGEIPHVNWINVNGREEHKALIKDENKMIELGLDPCFEIMVYLNRWGGWIEDEMNNNQSYPNQ